MLKRYQTWEQPDHGGGLECSFPVLCDECEVSTEVVLSEPLEEEVEDYIECDVCGRTAQEVEEDREKEGNEDE